MVTLSEQAAPTNDGAIDLAERELGLEFPAEYRAFLLHNNGGRPNLSVFPIQGDMMDDHGIANRFLPVDPKSDYDIVFSMALRDGRYPTGFLNIADDPGGNAICIQTVGDNKGKVYFWDHENEVEEGAEPNYQNVYLIANSFDEFINSLQDESVLEVTV